MKENLKTIAVLSLIFLGVLQGLAFIRDSSLLVLARSTASSPLSLAFYNSNGVEFWALEHTVEGMTDQNEKFNVKLDAGDVNKTHHPYFIRMIYAYPFAFSHELPESLWRKSLEYGICKDPTVRQILKIKGNIKNIKITIKTSNPMFKDEPVIISHTCGILSGEVKHE